MNKKLATIVTIAVLLAAMGGLLFYLNGMDDPLEEEESSLAPSNDYYILGSEEGGLTLSKIQVENALDAYTVVVDSSEEEQHTIAGMEDVPLVKSELLSVVNNLSTMRARDLVEENSANLGIYGLDKPQATVTVTASEGTKQVLIGDEAPSNSGYYVKTGDSSDVYLLTLTTAERYLKSSLDWINLQLTSGDPEGTTLFDTVTLGGTVREEEIVVEPRPEDEGGAATVFSSHVITTPVSLDLDYSKGAPLLASAFGLTAERAVAVHPDGAELIRLGLAEPYSTISVTYTEGEGEEAEQIAFTLQASCPDEEGMCNIVLTDRSQVVYAVHKDRLSWLEIQVFDLQGKLAVTPFIDNVAKVTVTIRGTDNVFLLTGEGDELAVTFDGVALDVANFRKFYQSLMSASHREYLGQEVTEDMEPVMQYTYEYRTGDKPDVVAFYEGEARRILISVNGMPANLLESTYMDRILDDIEKLRDGQPVKSYL